MNYLGISAPDAANLDRNVFGLFAQQAAAAPGKVAVVARDRDLTYGELYSRALYASRFLVDNGLTAEEPIAIWLERRADVITLMLGVWHAGGAYVPIDPDEPPARVRQLLEQSRCQKIIGNRRLLDSLKTDDADAPSPTLLDVADIDFDQTITASAECAAECAGSGARLAYLLFTSGSTGAPKAAEIEHRAVVNLMLTMRDEFKMTQDDRYLAVSTIAFDSSVAEIFLPLTCGASLLMRDRKDLLDPKRLASDIRDHNVTIFQTGPTVWSLLLDEAPDFPRLRLAISTGEATTPTMLRRLLPYGDEVWNLYGPTETTVWAVGYNVTEEILDGLPEGQVFVPIGHAVAKLEMQIVREDGTPAAPNEKGELYIAGAGLARAYRGNQELTADCFINYQGARMYRTGDLTSRDEDGVIHYYGRNDNQLKIRGVRIEPGEVEAAILKNPDAVKAAVTWFETTSTGRSIVAAIVMAPGVTGSPSKLHAALEKLLPKQMIPARFLFVPWLPVNANGKIDRAAIREAATAPTAEKTVTPPSPAPTQTEKGIGQIWRRMLSLSAVDQHDHFLSIGGDSLAAVQMMVEVEALFDIELPMQMIFEAPTLGEFAKRIDEHRVSDKSQISHDFIFPLVEAPGKTPLFFSQTDLSIARRWAAPCPLYEIAFWAKGSGFIQAASVEEMAAKYLERIRKIQPNGPYRLGGFSLGGLIAYEMAQQLKRQGEKVEILLMLDPMGPINAEGVERQWRPDPLKKPFKDRVKRHLRLIARGPRKLGLRVWFSKLVPLYKLPGAPWAIYHLAHLFGRHPNPLSLMLLPKDLWHGYWYSAQRITKDYVAKPYNGPALAVFVENATGADIWAPLLGPSVRVEKLRQTDHDSLFEDPAFTQWMTWFRDSISRSSGDE